MSIKTRATQWLSRRNLLAGVGLATAGAAVHAGMSSRGATAAESAGSAADQWIAKAEIAELRRRYALATDLIGLNTGEGIEQGRAIYRRVFTENARIGATGQPMVTGPDAWVKIAADALKPYKDTQHLIGTQIVDLQQLPDARGQGGRATMSSYLQAWHARPDNVVWQFMGTYNDQVVYTPGIGWQISEMILEQVSGDTRKIDTAT